MGNGRHGKLDDRTLVSPECDADRRPRLSHRRRGGVVRRVAGLTECGTTARPASKPFCPAALQRDGTTAARGKAARAEKLRRVQHSYTGKSPSNEVAERSPARLPSVLLVLDAFHTCGRGPLARWCGGAWTRAAGAVRLGSGHIRALDGRSERKAEARRLESASRPVAADRRVAQRTRNATEAEGSPTLGRVTGSAEERLDCADVGARVAGRLKGAGVQLPARSRVLEALIGDGPAPEQVLVGDPRREDSPGFVVRPVLEVQPPEACRVAADLRRMTARDVAEAPAAVRPDAGRGGRGGGGRGELREAGGAGGGGGGGG